MKTKKYKHNWTQYSQPEIIEDDKEKIRFVYVPDTYWNKAMQFESQRVLHPASLEFLTKYHFVKI